MGKRGATSRGFAGHRPATRRRARPAPEKIDEAVDLLYVLIGFDTFDALVGKRRDFEGAAAVVRRLARDSLGLGGQ